MKIDQEKLHCPTKKGNRKASLLLLGCSTQHFLRRSTLSLTLRELVEAGEDDNEEGRQLGVGEDVLKRIKLKIHQGLIKNFVIKKIFPYLDEGCPLHLPAVDESEDACGQEKKQDDRQKFHLMLLCQIWFAVWMLRKKV